MRREFPARVKNAAWECSGGFCEVGRVAHMPHIGAASAVMLASSQGGRRFRGWRKFSGEIVWKDVIEDDR